MNISTEIKKIIMRQLYKGEIHVDSKLPSINESVKVYGTSASTVKKAYNWLVFIGVLYKRQGSGYFVAKGWDLKVIHSPTLDNSTTSTEAIEILDSNSKFFAWENDKKIIANRMRIVKFYYKNNNIQKYSAILVNSNYAGKPKVKVFKESFISYLYQKNIHPQSEELIIKTKKAADAEADLLNIKRNDFVVTTKILLFDSNKNEICRTLWMEKIDSFSFSITKNNY